MDKEWISNVIDSNACKHYSKPAVRGKPAAEVGWQHYTTLSEYDLERVAERIAQAAEEEMMAAQEKWPIETVLLLGQLRVSTGLIKQAKQQLEHLETESAGLRAQVLMALALADSWEEYDGEWGEIDPGRCICADNLRQALSAAPKVVWHETLTLNEAGHIYVRAQSGYKDEGQYWLDDFWNPGQLVTVTVRTREE